MTQSDLQADHERLLLRISAPDHDDPSWREACDLLATALERLRTERTEVQRLTHQRKRAAERMSREGYCIIALLMDLGFSSQTAAEEVSRWAPD